MKNSFLVSAKIVLGRIGLPGGHLEFGESMQEGVRRELREERDLR